jgi:hypothetical protein
LLHCWDLGGRHLRCHHGLRQSARGRVAVVRVLGQRPAQHQLQGRGQLGTQAQQAGHWLRDVFDGETDRRIRFIRRVAGQHRKEERAQGVDVTALVELGCPSRLLRAHVGGRADDEIAGDGGRRFRRQLDDAKVRQVSCAEAVEEHVVRFDVTVDDPLLVGAIEGRRKPAQNRRGRGERQGTVALQALFERASLHVAHHQVGRSVCLAEVVDWYNRRVFQGGNGLRLALETGPEHGIVLQGWRQELKGNPATKAWIVSQIDGSHAALAQLALYLVAAKRVRCHLTGTLAAADVDDDGANVVAPAGFVSRVDQGGDDLGGIRLACRNSASASSPRTISHKPSLQRRKRSPGSTASTHVSTVTCFAVPQRARDDVTAGMGVDGIGRHLAPAHQARDVGMVIRDLHQLAAAPDVGPAVADVGDGAQAIGNQQTGQGRPQIAGVGRVLPRIVEDAAVGFGHSRFEAPPQLDGCFLFGFGRQYSGKGWLAVSWLEQPGELLAHGLDGQVAGYLTRLMTPHPVGDDEEASRASPVGRVQKRQNGVLIE